MRMMDIEFHDFEKELSKMQDVFNAIGQDALYMSHYELADADTEGNTPIDWRTFLTDPRVQDYLEGELYLMQQASVRKMMRDIDQSKSTGQAQLLNTLIQQSDKAKIKEGPIFIYTYIPLNEQEVHAPDVHIGKIDPFKINVDDYKRPDGRPL